jgi:hypothetical protein
VSAWNGVLQACHSALIDALNARFPESKLELGLPKRFDGWGTPDPGHHLLLRGIQCTDGEGFFVIGADAQSMPEAKEILVEAIARAEREFSLRSIDASFFERAKEPSSARMTIWMPIRVLSNPAWNCDLAISV